MDLTSAQLTGLIPAMAKAANPAFLEMSPLERAGFLQEIMEQIYPVLQALPNGATGANLENFQPIFKKCAEELAIHKLRQVLIYRDEPDEVLRSRLNPEGVETLAAYLHQLTELAFSVLPEDHSLEDMLEHFDELDLDGELERLTEPD